MFAALARANGSRIARTWVASVCLVAAPLAASARAAASSPPQSFGAWEGPWDWSCQVLGFAPANCPTNPTTPTCSTGAPVCPLLELAHAALIPTGRHRGKALLWRNESLWCCNSLSAPKTTEAWLFDPAVPMDLIKVEQNAPLDANLFCSGHAWDERGRLVIAGGPTFSSPLIARSSYRFLPNSLGVITTPPGGYPVIPPQALGDPWSQLGDLALTRWYPTLLTSSKEPIPERLGSNACDNVTTPGSATLALGGAFDQTSGQCAPGTPCASCPECMKGLEVWERLVGGAWTCPVIPAGLPTTNSHHPDPSSNNTESYVETVLPPPNPPLYRYLDSYPRTFQLSAASGKEIFAAFDTSSGASDPNSSPPNSSWVMKVPYASTQPPSQTWELRMALESTVQAGGDGDRWYGNAVMLHTRSGSNLLRDRVVVLNGRQTYTVGAPLNTKVLEFEPGGDPASTGQWRDKATLPFTGAASARLYSNAVVLPTGQILVVGGENGACATQPYLIDIGAQSTDLATVTPLQVSSNNHPRTGVPTPRLYHAVALLLPDGRVFLGGGDDDHGPCTTSGTLAASYSGEIYSSPYLLGGSRPHIDSAPSEVHFSDTSAVTFNVGVVSELPPQKAVLLRPASVTHFFDVDQRYIELDVSFAPNGPGEWSATVTSPTSDLGPAGWYMLFVLAPVEVLQGQPAMLAPSLAHFIRLK